MSRGGGRGFAQFVGAGSSGKKWTILLVVLLASISLTAQLSGRPNRIMQTLSAKPVVELSGTLHPLTAKATDMGSVSPDLPLNSMTIHIAPSAAQRLEIAALQKELEDPKSPQYHKWLTQAQYGARFGLTDADLSQMKLWLTTQGFAVKSVSTSRNSIMFSGKATQAEAAFHTQLHQYKLDGESHFANATTLHVPAQFAGVVATLNGLNTFRAIPNTKRLAALPNFTDGSGLHYLSPADWATIYNVNTLYNQGFDGTGMHVGVVGQTYAPQADIDNFRALSGLPATKLTYFCVGLPVCTAETATSAVGDVFQADLDIEWAGGIAKNAMVDYIYTSPVDLPLGVFDALTYAVQSYKTADGSILPIISISYSLGCEAVASPADATRLDLLGEQAKSQGQTLVVASGDSGAAGCDGSTPGQQAVTSASHGLSVTVPADSPNYTAVGGTMFSGDVANPSSSWDPTSGLALGYIAEQAWNETGTTGQVPLAASGGGESTLFLPPTGQPVINSSTGRLVPDVAFAAASGHDGYLNCSSDQLYLNVVGATCATGQYTTTTNGTVIFPAGGTSAATSSFAGMLTLFAQRYGPLVDFNSRALYTIAGDPASYLAAFHDIVVGDNIVPCDVNSPDCGSGQIGYTTEGATGYDLVTGLGSVNGAGMFTALAGIYGSGDSVTATAVAVAPTSITFGGTVTITATVTSQTPGTISGPVVFTTSAPPITLGTAPITVTAGVATATLSIATTGADGLIAGSDTITANYNGGPGYLLSTGNTTLVVIPPVVVPPSYTLNASALGVTLSANGSKTVTLTLAPTNYTGTVNFAVSVTSTNGTATNLVASAPSVTFTGGSKGSALTITANASAVNRAPVVPWKSGGAVVFCVVLLGTPFGGRRKRALAVLLTALAISLAGFVIACGGGGGSSTPAPAPTPTATARRYTVTVTPTGTGAVTDAPPVVIIVTVP